jgi:hypothetical protein
MKEGQLDITVDVVVRRDNERRTTVKGNDDGGVELRWCGALTREKEK